VVFIAIGCASRGELRVKVESQSHGAIMGAVVRVNSLTAATDREGVAVFRNLKPDGTWSMRRLRECCLALIKRGSDLAVPPEQLS
jgi:hypothetical protein